MQLYEILGIAQNDQTKTTLENKLIDELSNTIARAVKILRPIFISKREKGGKSNTYRTIGFKKVKVSTIIYRFIFLSPLLIDAMFGSDLDKLSVKEKHTTKNCKIIHISLADRLNGLLSIDRVYLNEYETKDRVYSFCGKVIFFHERTKRRIIRYIL